MNLVYLCKCLNLNHVQKVSIFRSGCLIFQNPLDINLPDDSTTHPPASLTIRVPAAASQGYRPSHW